MKFIANVTYGYTSASFSGRMPAVEIADAIVQSGRETLEKVNQISRIHVISTQEHVYRPSKLSIRLSSGEHRLCMVIPILYSYI
jgi:hypothetical protein